MKVLVIGAASRLGGVVIEKAMSLGHQVTAFTRDTSQLIPSANLQPMMGDVLHLPDVERAIPGHDVVLITLDQNTASYARSVLSKGTRNVVAVMEKSKVRRVVAVLSGWLFSPAYPIMFKEITAEHEQQLVALECSNLDWIAVCPATVMNVPSSRHYRVGIETLPPRGFHISTYDVADFVLAQLDSGTYVHKAVGIAY